MTLLEADEETSKKQPVFNLPWIIPALIGFMALIHFLRISVLTEQTNYEVIIQFAFIPLRYGHEQLLAFSPYAGYWSPITYSFLHADWTHFLMNSFWLLAFGGITARRLGAVKFLILFVVGAILGAGLHYIIHTSNNIPMIGASASVSACMGAAMRLPSFSSSSFHGDITQIRIRSLMEALTNRQALTFIGIWFGMNLIFGIGIIDISGNGDSIAWEAHIGGFVAGLLLFGFIDRLFKK